MNSAEIETKLIELIAKKFGIPKEKISSKSFFSTDLGLSSFDAMSFVCDIEETFNCDVPDKEIKSIKTVGDLVSCIQRYKR